MKSKEGIVFVSDKRKAQKNTPVLNTLKEWREFEYSRTQKRTPVIETLDAMIARVERGLAAESKNEQIINFRGR
jgi:hypothetical protein